MKYKIGTKFQYNFGIVIEYYEVESYLPFPKYYTLRDIYKPNATWSITEESIDDFLKEGTFILLTQEPKDANCSYHSWKRYVGFRKIVDYCETCGKEQHVDWRTLGTKD